MLRVPGKKVDQDLVDLSHLWSPRSANDIPASILNPPFDVFSETVDWLDGYERRTSRLNSIAGAILIAMGGTARVFISDEENITTGYFVRVDGTGKGKDYIRKALNHAFIEAGIKDVIGPSDTTSESGLRFALASRPAMVSAWDEIGDTLSHAMNDKGGPKCTLFRFLREVYSSWDVLMPKAYGPAGSKTSHNEPIYNACFGFFGLTTEKQLMDSLTYDMLSDGTINRILFIHGPSPSQKNNEKNKRVPKRLLLRLQAIRQLAQSNGISFTESSRKANLEIIPFEESFYRVYSGIGETDDLPGESVLGDYCHGNIVRSEFASRWREMAMRLATAISGLEGHSQIKASTFQWCWDFVFFFGCRFVSVFEESATQSAYESRLMKLLSQIRQAGRDGLAKHELSRHGFGRSLEKRERDKLIQHLVDSKLILAIETKTTRPKVTYYALKDHGDISHTGGVS